MRRSSMRPPSGGGAGVSVWVGSVVSVIVSALAGGRGRLVPRAGGFGAAGGAARDGEGARAPRRDPRPGALRGLGARRLEPRVDERVPQASRSGVLALRSAPAPRVSRRPAGPLRGAGVA